MPLFIKHINYYIHPKGHRLHFQELRQGTERIEILTKGKGWILHGKDEIEVERGDILWHQKGESSIHRSDIENPYECLNIIGHLDDDRSRPFQRVNQWYDLEDLDKFCHQTENDFSDGLIPKPLFNTHTLSVIEYQITKSMVSDRLSKFPSSLKKAITFIEKNFLTELNIKTIASRANLSVTHLHELFRTHLKTSPHQHIIKLRISQACQQLTVSSDPIKKIAFECGFNSDNSFCRSFRQHKKMTPDQFREKYS